MHWFQQPSQWLWPEPINQLKAECNFYFIFKVELSKQQWVSEARSPEAFCVEVLPFIFHSPGPCDFGGATPTRPPSICCLLIPWCLHRKQSTLPLFQHSLWFAGSTEYFWCCIWLTNQFVPPSFYAIPLRQTTLIEVVFVLSGVCIRMYMSRISHENTTKCV